MHKKGKKMQQKNTTKLQMLQTIIFSVLKLQYD